jgi:hypothetical protein
MASRTSRFAVGPCARFGISETLETGGDQTWKFVDFAR